MECCIAISSGLKSLCGGLRAKTVVSCFDECVTQPSPCYVSVPEILVQPASEAWILSMKPYFTPLYRVPPLFFLLQQHRNNSIVRIVLVNTEPTNHLRIRPIRDKVSIDVVPEWNEPCIYGCKHPLVLHNNSVGMLPTELPPVRFMNTNLLAAASFFALRKQTTRRNYTTIDQRARFRMYFKGYNIVILLLSVGQLSRTQSVDTSTGKPDRRLLEFFSTSGLCIRQAFRNSFYDLLGIHDESWLFRGHNAFY